MNRAAGLRCRGRWGHWLGAEVWRPCPSWPTVERGGSGPAPCGVLSSLCALCPLHNGLRKLDRGQVIGLEIDNNKAGPGSIWGPSRCYSGRDPGRLAGEKWQAGRCPSGILAVSEQTPPPAQTPSATMTASPCWRQQRDPVKPALECPPTLLQSLCFALSRRSRTVIVATSPLELAVSLS